jgi:arabinogalactan oligomer/maltooligosaccharide transport system substrate-binding protein
MKKRLISGVLLAAMMLTSLAGCGAATDSKEEAQASKDTVTGAIFDGTLEENVTIRVLENDTAISKGYFQELIDAFNAEYAQYGITAVDANMDQYLDLANDGPYGYGPDVLYQANDVLMQ